LCGRLGRNNADVADHRQCPLLGLGCKRPCGDRATEPSDELAPSKANAHLPLLVAIGALSRQDSTSEGCGPRSRSPARSPPGGQGRLSRILSLTTSVHPRAAIFGCCARAAIGPAAAPAPPRLRIFVVETVIGPEVTTRAAGRYHI